MLALTSLRNQLTVKYNESTLPPDDGRIRLAREWMEMSPGAKELFDLWTTINQVRLPYLPFCSST
jgi:nucleolar pre-ribosomal-associated protein 1